ncbi:MAG: redoxin domain-containing protein [Bacteroidetes bacterium]|nr:redoxin domain-containing protein [Bacteroidota bacterium]
MSIQLKPGDLAPQFTLFNTEKKEVSLSDYRGKNLVILFFPQSFTGVCTTELCAVRDGLSEYQSLNAEVVAISVDSLFTLGAFREAQHFNFEMLSDFNKEVCQAYGAYYDTFVFNMHGVAKRAAFVVDAEGIIRYAEVLESAGDIPNFDAVRGVLQSLNGAAQSGS